ncbi:hypothetical protein EBZ39_05600 [bacterium]|nr:hypothetical protein [bacterium]
MVMQQWKRWLLVLLAVHASAYAAQMAEVVPDGGAVESERSIPLLANVCRAISKQVAVATLIHELSLHQSTGGNLLGQHNGCNLLGYAFLYAPPAYAAQLFKALCEHEVLNPIVPALLQDIMLGNPTWFLALGKTYREIDGRGVAGERAILDDLFAYARRTGFVLDNALGKFSPLHFAFDKRLSPPVFEALLRNGTNPIKKNTASETLLERVVWLLSCAAQGCGDASYSAEDLGTISRALEQAERAWQEASKPLSAARR